jgi:hypothetical protein
MSGLTFLPAAVITPVIWGTIVVIAESPFRPLALAIAVIEITLPLPLPDDGVSVPPIIVAINSLRFGLRPAGGASGDYESYGQSGSG